MTAATTTVTSLPEAVADGLAAGTLCPYLGPGLLALCAGARPPANALELAAVLTARVSVPGKIRNRLTAAAQFIENFKHRKTLVGAMDAAFAAAPEPSALHRWLAALPSPFIVDAWYDDTLRRALAGRSDWAEVQGLAQSEHFGTWTGWYQADGTPSAQPLDAATVFYKPWGGRSPASNYLVSDSDFVEVLTEIDIQTPIPAIVQQRRAGVGFVFLGCRFDDQLPRAFARQIMKRSAGPHWAVLPEEPTRMERRFLEEQGIVRIALPLAEVAAALAGVPEAA
ncbi:SIR2 family NAD-dependent protein deacylase [Rubrivivax gelatinosus]|uniref:SIR2 family protein n=1 Tax=Rubrivivax gelatinosus TaxID=28068 RepID=A0ABS1DXA1_RUBGE|nr:SIR2 family protein [Rubrivivax gelatinosus]MBK1714697.1 SIR2 family protein [Rubrivivax gelatinosus]